MKNNIEAGVKGWLKFFVIVYLYVKPVVFVLGTISTWILLAEVVEEYPRVILVELIETGVGAFLVCKWILIARHLRDIRPGAVKEAKTWLIIGLGWSVLGVPIAFISEMPTASLLPGMIMAVAGGLVGFAIWFSFFNVSKRVKATYDTPSPGEGSTAVLSNSLWLSGIVAASVAIFMAWSAWDNRGRTDGMANLGPSLQDESEGLRPDSSGEMLERIRQLDVENSRLRSEISEIKTHTDGVMRQVIDREDMLKEEIFDQEEIALQLSEQLAEAEQRLNEQIAEAEHRLNVQIADAAADQYNLEQSLSVLIDELAEIRGMTDEERQALAGQEITLVGTRAILKELREEFDMVKIMIDHAQSKGLNFSWSSSAIMDKEAVICGVIAMSDLDLPTVVLNFGIDIGLGEGAVWSIVRGDKTIGSFQIDKVLSNAATGIVTSLVDKETVRPGDRVRPQL